MTKHTLQATKIDLDDFKAEHSFLQSKLWAEQKASFAWQPLPLRIESTTNGMYAFDLMVLLRPLALGFYLAYVPHGPSEAHVQNLVKLGLCTKQSVLKAIAQSIAKCTPQRFLCIRYDLDWVIDTNASIVSEATQHVWSPRIRDELKFEGIRRAPADIQPPDTVILDLSPEEDQLLANMKAKTRYNIKLAQKKGVTVRTASANELAQWYQLYAQTAERDKIGIHSLKYYQTLLDNNPEKCRLLLAEHEGEILAGVILLHFNNKTTYLYGASSNAKRNLMPAYALQWAAISLAKQNASTEYDFFGIPPLADEHHPMFGLYQFKTGFGGTIIHYAGTWDYPLSFFVYTIVRIIESIRFYKQRFLSKKK